MQITNSKFNQYLEKFTKYSFYLWCIAIGWSTAVINITMITTTLLVITHSHYNKQLKGLRELIVHPTVVLFAILFVSILWSEDVINSFKNLKSYLPFILFPISFQFWYKHQQEVIYNGVRFLIYSLIIAYFITIVWNQLPFETATQLSIIFSDIVQPFTNSDKNYFGWYVPFMERIHFVNLLVYSGVASFFLFIKYKKLHFLCIAIFFLTGPFILGARAAMIGVVISLPILLIYAINQYSKKLQPFIFLTGFVIVSIVTYISFPNIQSRYHQTVFELQSIQDQSYLDHEYRHFATLTRIVSWQHAWNMFIEKPLIGHGIGAYLEKYENIYILNNDDLPMTYHSQWLYFLGVFGVVGIFIVICSYIYYWLQLKTQLANIYFWCFSIYISVIWLFDTGLLQKKEMMAFVIFLSFTHCLEESDISFI